MAAAPVDAPTADTTDAEDARGMPLKQARAIHELRDRKIARRGYRALGWIFVGTVLFFFNIIPAIKAWNTVEGSCETLGFEIDYRRRYSTLYELVNVTVVENDREENNRAVIFIREKPMPEARMQLWAEDHIMVGTVSTCWRYRSDVYKATYSPPWSLWVLLALFISSLTLCTNGCYVCISPK